MKRSLLSAATLLLYVSGYGTTFHVGTNGSGHPYTQIKTAAAAASPGDTILLHGGTYNSENVGETIQNLHGLPNAWYHILAEPLQNVYVEGGWSEALKLSQASYIHISGIKFRNSGWGNMVNIDDGGTYSPATHNILIEKCVFSDILGQQNSDVLKLTGVDTFTVRNCRFYRGAYDENQGGDGAGIDMNGCHEGVIEENYFEYPGRFALQTKAGCHKIIIRRNFFQARPYIPIACERTVQIGGSHGGIFRPLNANYNAKDIWVYSNIFSGGWAPIAFVGAVNSHVVNNTFFKPENWIIRILQEQTVSDAGVPLLACGNNSFRNNIIYLGDMSPFGELQVNYGTTDPGSFIFNNNFWYKFNDPSWTGPANLPVLDQNSTIGLDPLFTDTSSYNFHLNAGSPAIGMGAAVPQVLTDYYNQPFNSLRSAGAIEFSTTTGIVSSATGPGLDFEIFPMPCTELSKIYFSNSEKRTIRILDINGREVYTANSFVDACPLPSEVLGAGIYIAEVLADKTGAVARKKFIIVE